MEKHIKIDKKKRTDKVNIYKNTAKYDSKVYKEDTEKTFTINSKLTPDTNIEKRHRNQRRKKNKSIDDRRHKIMNKIKTMPHHLMKELIDQNRMLSTNFLPGAGKKLDTIYNKTLSLL